jgi:hypothetical protein
MSGEVEMISQLSGCSKEDALKAWEEFGDVVEAVDNLLPGKSSKKTKELSEEQKFFKEMRETMKIMDEKRQINLVSHEPCEQDEQQDHHEETVLQNNCFQECLIPSLESKVEKQEIACPLQSGCSCDLQLNGQK